MAGDGIDNDGNGYVDDINGWDFTGSRAKGTTTRARWTPPEPYFSQSTARPRTAPTSAAPSPPVPTIGLGGVGNAGGGNGKAGSGAQILPLRWDDFPGGGFNAVNISRAFAYAADNGAKIINSSYNFDQVRGCQRG